MDADKVLTPFVSVDLVNDCIRMVRTMLQGAKYQLLEPRVMQRVFEVLSEQLQSIEKAVGVNMLVWKMWMRGKEDDFLNFSKMGLGGVNWYIRGSVKREFEAAAKDCIDFVKSGEHSAEWSHDPLHALCLRICLWMQPRFAEKSLTEQNVTMLLKPVAAYLSLLSELDSLNRQATRHNIPLKQPPKQTKKESNAEIAMERGQKYFQRAIDKGMMREASKDKGERGLYIWTYDKGSLISLAYFLRRIYTPTGEERIPAKVLAEWFGVGETIDKGKKLLSASVNQTKNHFTYEVIDALFVD